MENSEHDKVFDRLPLTLASNKEAKKVSKPSVIPAVEVEAPECSFNPAYESHQESLAQAVAEEMQKVYQNELGPDSIPFVVPGHAIDDKDVSRVLMYFGFA
ncbi:hypothetical protein Dsin_000106 [Dipteronia sinensis]|uniref:Ribosome biogenesis protein NOP53 n=1 Tax=Dipteronia sinensis TaxID=43782 RepID=A0AAD9Z2Q4_9ROSI|nr:hypothetical protein Dsin_000106 [Dipteronia sinensis]